jgi:hypothetical protein
MTLEAQDEDGFPTAGGNDTTMQITRPEHRTQSPQVFRYAVITACSGRKQHSVNTCACSELWNLRW